MANQTDNDGKYEDNHLSNAFELVTEIKRDIDEAGFEEPYISVKVDLDDINNVKEVSYLAETSDIYEEENLEKPGKTSISGLYELDSKDEFSADEEIIRDALEDNLDSALMLNGNVIQGLNSPDYNAFK